MISIEDIVISEDIKHTLDVLDDVKKTHPTYTISTKHLLYSMLADGRTLAYDILESVVMSFHITSMIDEILKDIRTTSISILNPRKKIKTDSEYNAIMEVAYKECAELNDIQLTTEHILLAILKTDSEIKSKFNKIGVNYDTVKFKIIYNRNESKNDSPTRVKQKPNEIILVGNGGIVSFTPKLIQKKGKTPNIENFCTNINVLQENGKLDRVLYREDELQIMFKILLKRNKNNIVITGNSGCGLTSMVNLLSEKIVSGECPPSLIGKEILRINISNMIAGCSMRGQFEERSQILLKEIQGIENKYILFVEDIHNVLNDENNKEVFSFINTLIEDDSQQFIMTCPSEFYKKTLENKPFEKRLTKLALDNLSIQNTIDIINTNKTYYEVFHNVLFSNEVIEKAVTLSDRYITNRVLPSSCLDVIDTCGSAKSVENSISEETKQTVADISALRERVNETIKHEEFKLADIYKIELKKLEKKLKTSSKMNVSPIDITIDDILSTISGMTKIPMATLSSHDLSNLKDIGKNIKCEIIGQDDAVEKAVKAIQKKRIGLKDNNKKPPVLMLIGSSGVGKTLLAKTVAKTVFHDEKNMLRIDCSELSQEHDIAKLIGAPPGYIGYNRPLLLDKLRETPYCVVLFDEIEKANATAYNLMLQIFDEGRLSTASGDLIDFSNSIIFITSNIGTKTASEYKNIGFTSDNINKDTKSEDIIKKSLKKQFAPEFLNRIDSIIYFNSLNENVLKKIIHINLNKLKIVLNEKQEKYSIKWNDNIVNFLYSKISQDDKNLGARPILRLIDQYVENPLIDSLIENEYSDGYEFNIIENGDELIIK